MYKDIYIYIYTCVYTCTSTIHIHTYILIYVPTYKIYKYIYKYIHAYTYVYVDVSIHITTTTYYLKVRPQGRRTPSTTSILAGHAQAKSKKPSPILRSSSRKRMPGGNQAFGQHTRSIQRSTSAHSRNPSTA